MTDAERATGEEGVVIVIDARGQRCPQPVILLGRTAAHLAREGSFGQIEVLADDPAAESDIPAWCRMRGSTLVSSADEPGGGRRYRVTVPPR